MADPPIYDLPIVKIPKDPPPPPKDPPRQIPKVHTTQTVIDPPPLPPLVTEIPEKVVPTIGPVASLTPPPNLDPPARHDPVIHDPRWVSKPGAGEFSRFYPERALRMERQGTAELTCGVKANGEVTNCRVTAETPENFGFGQAALKLSRYLQIAPKTIDGQPVDGGTLIVPIQFRLPS